MEKQVITVKYIGKWDAMTCDFNGKRYCFRSRERISTIPTEVYDHIKQNKDVLSYDLIPYQPEHNSVDDDTEDVEEDIKDESTGEVKKVKKTVKKTVRRK